MFLCNREVREVKQRSATLEYVHVICWIAAAMHLYLNILSGVWGMWPMLLKDHNLTMYLWQYISFDNIFFLRTATCVHALVLLGYLSCLIWQNKKHYVRTVHPFAIDDAYMRALGTGVGHSWTFSCVPKPGDWAVSQSGCIYMSMTSFSLQL